MTSRQLRLARAAAVSFVATLIAAVSHTLGGGAAPHPLLIIAVVTLLTPLCAVLVGAKQSRPRVTAAVLLSQAAFHLLFQALGSPTGAGTSAASGHSHHTDLPVVDLSLLDAAAPAATADATMLFAHIVAAALTTLLVWHGETILRAIAGWFLAVLLRATLGAPSAHQKPVRLRSLLRPSFDAAVSPAVSRRGPPVLARG